MAWGGYQVDATDFFNLSKEFKALPEAVKHKVAVRALKRMQTRARTEATRWASKRIKLPAKLIRDGWSMPKVTSKEATLYLKTGWVPLYKLGATKGKRGAKVRGRKQVRGSFLATMQSGHTGVYKRSSTRKMADSNKAAIYELFGPNPANDMVTAPDFYEKILADIISKELSGRMLHELGRILPE